MTINCIEGEFQFRKSATSSFLLAVIEVGDVVAGIKDLTLVHLAYSDLSGESTASIAIMVWIVIRYRIGRGYTHMTVQFFGNRGLSN